MDWISKEFLLAVCGSLLIALIAVALPRPLIQYPSPQATEGAQGAADKAGDGFDYSRLRSYVDLATNYCTSESPNRQEEWGRKFICESKITDAVIALLTFFLAIFTGLLVRVGNKQERTTRQQMRAFVYINNGSILNVANPENPHLLPDYKPTGAQRDFPRQGPLAYLTITNSGSTPAFDVMHWAGIAFDDHPIPKDLPKRIPMDNPPLSVLPPNGINTKSVRLGDPLTDEQIASLRDSTKAIYVYGEITYVDAFRRKRQTNYRLFHNAHTGNIGVTTDLSWAEGDGNNAT